MKKLIALTMSLPLILAGTFALATHLPAPHDHCASANVTPVSPGEISVECEGVVPPNQPPVANADTNSGPSNTVLVGNVLTNDTDPENQTLSVTSGQDINSDGSYSINRTTPGVVEIPYEISDGNGGVASSTLTLTFTNQAPVVVDDEISGNIPFNAQGNVLSNDSDPDGGTLSIQQPNANINADGSFNIPHSTEGDFTYPYTVLDGQGGSTDGELRVEAIDNTPPPTGLVAFPGADGAGRFAIGGRGGVVMQVTNLNDSGAGSLRACAEATGPRTCVFRVSGNIGLDVRPIEVSSPFITIAGETAPGQGINLFNDTNTRDAMIVRTHDVIISHIRMRTNHPPHNISPNGRNLLIGDILGNNEVYNVIVDHSSFSWATDQPFDVSPESVPREEASDVSRVTLQNSLVYEGLRPHSKGPNYRSCGISTIKSMIASTTIRNPNNTCGKWAPGTIRVGGGVTGETEFRNNVVYNGGDAFFDMWDGRGEAWANIVGNVFKKGPVSLKKLNSNMTHDVYAVDAWHFENRQVPSGTCAQNNNAPNCASGADALHMYLDDNIQLPGAGKTWPTNGITDGGVLNPNDAHLLSTAPVGDGVFEDGVLGPAMPASQVFAYVMENAGAFPNNRDSADARIVQDAINGTGDIPYCTQTSGATTCDLKPALPTLAGGSNYPDSDTDGMDDTWEVSNLGGTSASGTADNDNDGYTNLEEFLHFMSATR